MTKCKKCNERKATAILNMEEVCYKCFEEHKPRKMVYSTERIMEEIINGN